MKIIQTFWSGKSIDQNVIQHRGGWLSPETHWFSWALSCLQLCQFYDEIELITDIQGKELLIDTLQLPYTKVVTDLEDCLSGYPAELWALAKIKAYSLQTEPFLHVDGDVFIWQAFDNELVSQNIIAQNREVDKINYYERVMQQLEQHCTYIPNEIRVERQKGGIIQSINAGVFGGSGITFFQNYSQKAFEFVDNNTSTWQNLDLKAYNVNVIFEQYLFYCLAQQQNKSISYLIDLEADFGTTYEGFADFHAVPYQTKFIHTLGDYKKYPQIHQHLAKRLRQDYPDYYYRILQVCQKNEVKLLNRAYDFEELNPKNFSAKKLNELKSNFVNQDFTQFPNIEIKLENEYHRTKAILAHINPNLIFAENNFGDLIEHIDNQAFRKCLLDVFKFEKAIIDFTYNLKSAAYYYAKDWLIYRQVEELFSLQEPDLLWQSFHLSADCLIIESEWKWVNVADANILVANLEAPTKFYQTLIFPEISALHLQEYHLDSLGMVLLDAFLETRTIQSAIEDISIYFDSQEIQKNSQKFKNLVLNKIKEMLYLGVLDWVK
jgi:hypothetical protein